MKVRVRYYARAAELAGLRNEEVEVADGVSLKEFLQVLPEKSKADLSRLLENGRPARWLRIALNHRVQADLEVKLRNGDTLAFLPPSSGG